MTFAEAVLAVLLARPVYKEDNVPELRNAKAAQLQRVADAVVTANRPPAGIGRSDWAALVLAIGEAESNWSLRIGRTECKPWECDTLRMRDGSLIVRAVGYWQPHKNVLNAEIWHTLIGEETELAQAHNANAMLARGYHTCKNAGVPWLQATINGYAGKRCNLLDWPGLRLRGKYWMDIRARLP